MTNMLQPKTVGPLAGLVIVDLTRVLAGPYCTMLLADLGARVIKVELPNTGDDARHIGPFADNGDGTQTSAYFFSVNRNKESIALDLKNPDDQVILNRLLESADVLVENTKPGTLPRHGFTPEEILRINPNIIYCAISGYGEDSPYRGLGGMDTTIHGMSGIMALTRVNDVPYKTGISIADLHAGQFALVAVLFYLRANASEGEAVARRAAARRPSGATARRVPRGARTLRPRSSWMFPKLRAPRSMSAWYPFALPSGSRSERNWMPELAAAGPVRRNSAVSSKSATSPCQ